MIFLFLLYWPHFLLLLPSSFGLSSCVKVNNRHLHLSD